MSRPKSGLPFFGTPPPAYDQRYMNDLVRSFNAFLTLYNNPGQGRHTTLTLTDVEDGDSGLEAGTLYVQGNSVYISRGNIAGIGSFSLTLSTGSVTVSIA